MNKTLFILSALIFTYFLFLVINSEFLHISSVGFGVFQELFTLPLLLVQVIIFVYTISVLIEKKFKVNKSLFWPNGISFLNVLFAVVSIVAAHV